MNLALICVAAGTGERFGGDKLAETIGSKTVLERSLSALCEALPEAPVILVSSEHRLEQLEGRFKPKSREIFLVKGGARRQDSVRNGVRAAVGLGADTVVVHDAARPLVNVEDVSRAVAGLGSHDGAILCGRVADTVKRVAEDGRITATIDRNTLRLAMTPQVFRVEVLLAAWEKADCDREWTDEAAMLEETGFDVVSVVANHPNPKLTTRSELALLRALVAEET
jgi:2-C-methyl-D-erythritol 4-phosphate cytidylyltransferase